MFVKIIASATLASVLLFGSLLLYMVRYGYEFESHFHFYVYDRLTGEVRSCLGSTCSVVDLSPHKQEVSPPAKQPNIFDQFDGDRVDRLEPVR